MRRLLLAILLPTLLAADEHWIKFTSGPFEVFTDAGARAGREAMVRFQQFRHALGQIVGEHDLQTPQPVRIFVFKNAKGWTSPAPLIEGRDRYYVVLQDKAPVTPAVYTRADTPSPAIQYGADAAGFRTWAAGVLLHLRSERDPHHRRRAPPAPTPISIGRAIHLLVTDPEYYGKIRVLLYNLRNGVDEDPALPERLREVPRRISRRRRKRTSRRTTSRPRPSPAVPWRSAISGEAGFRYADARLARADLLAGDQSAAEYHALLRDKTKDRRGRRRARTAGPAATGRTKRRATFRGGDGGGQHQRALLHRIRQAGARQRQSDAGAAEGRRDQPETRRAVRPDGAARYRLLANAWRTGKPPRSGTRAIPLIGRRSRNAIWPTTITAKRPRRGNRASRRRPTPPSAARMHTARMSIEQQRLDYEEAEKRREAEEEARELERLKAKARAEVHALEARYNKRRAEARRRGRALVGRAEARGKVTGMLKQVDCLGKQARLLVDGEDRKLSQAAGGGPAQIAISGGGEQALGCGVQKPRRVSSRIFPEERMRGSRTAGEVATIEFQ